MLSAYHIRSHFSFQILSMNTSRLPDIVAFGIQGAGKGEQGRILQRKFGYIPFSTGDAFRALDTASPLGAAIQGYTENGRLVPNDITINVINKYLKTIKNLSTSPLYFDGFPRSLSQIPLLDAIESSRGRVYQCLEFALPEEEARKRIQARARADDLDPAAVDKRINTYYKETRRVIDVYRERNMLHTINAEDSIENIALQTREWVEQLKIQSASFV